MQGFIYPVDQWSRQIIEISSRKLFGPHKRNTIQSTVYFVLYSYGRSRASNQICHGAFFVKSLKVQTRLREFLKIIPFIPGVPNEAPTVGQTGGSGGHTGMNFSAMSACWPTVAPECKN